MAGSEGRRKVRGRAIDLVHVEGRQKVQLVTRAP